MMITPYSGSLAACYDNATQVSHAYNGICNAQINNEDAVNAPVSISYDCTSTDTTSSVGDGTV